MTEDILKTVETFLSYSDEKLEELAQKNQALKLEKEEQDDQKGGEDEEVLTALIHTSFICQHYS